MSVNSQLLLYKDLLTLCRMLATASPDETYEETYEKAISFIRSRDTEISEDFHFMTSFAVMNILADLINSTVDAELRNIWLNPVRQNKWTLNAVNECLEDYYKDWDEDPMKTSILMTRLAFDIRKKSKARKKKFNTSQLKLTRLPLVVFDSTWTYQIPYFVDYAYDVRNSPSQESIELLKLRRANAPHFDEKVILGAMGCYVNIIYGLAKRAKKTAVEVIDELLEMTEELIAISHSG